MAFVFEEDTQQPESRFVLEQEPEAQERGVVADVPIQAARGLARAFTYPADLFKLAVRGATLEVLKDEQSQAIERGEEFDIGQAFAEAQKGLDLIPTQELAESLIEGATGIDLDPTTKAGKFTGRASEIFGFTPKSAASLGRRLGSAILGAAVGETAEYAGAPDIVADLLGFGAGGLASSARFAPKELAKGSAELEARQTAQKFGLRQFAGAEAESAPKKIIRTSESRINALKGELEETSKAAIDNILSEKLPAKKLQKEGHSLRELYSASFDKVEEIAARNPKTFSTDPLVKKIESKIEKIKGQAPSLSKESKDIIGLYDDQLDALRGLEIDSSTGIKQYREWNKDLKNIYKRPEFSGSQGAMSEAYADLKDDMAKLLEKNNGKEFIEEFRYSNSLYSQDKALQRAENILEKAFTDGYDPKKLNKALSSKEGRFLKRDIGKDAFKDLQNIAKYGERANEYVLKRLKPNDYARLGNYLKGGAAAIMLSNPATASASKLVASIAIPKFAYDKIIGRLATRNSTRKTLANLNKALAYGSEAAIAKASNNFNKALEKEFGSLENIMTDIEGDFLD